jgi:hypothetical protein
MAGFFDELRKRPKTQRAPKRRAIVADLADKSKAEGRSRRNCWRGARSVSPDINSRLRAFVPTSMRRSKNGLSLKSFALRCFFNWGAGVMDKGFDMTPFAFQKSKGTGRNACPTSSV